MKRNLIVCLIFAFVTIGFLSIVPNVLAPKTIVLDRMEINEVRITRIQILTGDPLIGEWKYLLSIQYRMLNAAGDSVIDSKQIILTPAQDLKIRKFLKPLVEALKTEVDIHTIDNWIDPGE